MTGLLWRLAGALSVGVIGLYMTFCALERAALSSLAAAPGEPGRPPSGTYLLLFGGLAILNLATFFALTRWHRFVRANPGMKQALVWLLIAIMIFAGIMLVTGVAVHSGWARSQEELPMNINQGFVVYAVFFSAMALVCLVLIAVRWSPGYKRRTLES